MKLFLKKIIPILIWETMRRTYANILQLSSDIFQTASPFRPIEWMRVLFLVRKVRPRYTMVSSPRLRVLYNLSRRIDEERVPGDIVECGVYNGGSAAIMASAQIPPVTRSIWLFDSFKGLPPPTEDDGEYERANYYEGWCEGSIKKVKEIFRKLHLSLEKLHIIEGWFEETLPRESSRIGSIALLHIDADWYDSVKKCLEIFYPKVSTGGYIEIDDYGKWEGCRKAVDEYLLLHKIKVELKTRDNSGFYFKKPRPS